MTLDERRHKARLVELGCVLCRRLFGINDSPPVLHHYRGGGWGKGGYLTLMPLCPPHHDGKEGVHGLGTKAFDRHYGFTQRDLLEDALRLVGFDDDKIIQVLGELSPCRGASAGRAVRP